MVERVIIDTDVGIGEARADIDDAFAIALAIASPELQVEALTTVNGNAPLDAVTRAGLRLLERLDRTDVPLYVGASRPLRRAVHHRPTDLQGVNASEPPPHLRPRPTPAAQAIAEHVLASPGRLTVIAIAPLTNIALALLLEPRVAHDVKRIVIMGGAYRMQTNQAALPGEFNFWVDPDAAGVVLGSAVPLELVGLDVTTQVRLTRDDVAKLASMGGAFGTYAATCATAWLDFLRRESTDPGAGFSCAMHDPLAVTATLERDLLSWQRANVRVEADSDVTRGIAVADFGARANAPPANADVAVDVDAQAVTTLFLDRIAPL